MRTFLAAAAIMTAALFASASQAQAPAHAPAQSPATPAGVNVAAAHALTADDVNAWLDGFVPAGLARGEIAGAVVVVVKDGQVLTERGYGVSDVATGAPVDPKTTAFRPGSISKLFAWTSVMQLVEQGKLNLDADINTYLDFRIPERNGKPITLRNLMTHTPGIEEADKHLIENQPRDLSMERALKRWTPTRVFDPGTTPAYSNYGAALAGYIVQRVSGEPFDAYVARHILQPLDMQNSSFSIPMPKHILDSMSKGYRDATKPPQPFEVVVESPAGNLAATGDDMAHFMIAHLQNGRYGDTQILKPETAHLMHDSITQLMAPLNGMALGFIVGDINGRRVIGHSGDTAYFHSGLWLFLNDNVGLYVSVNSGGLPGGFSRYALIEAFADRYFPAPNTDGTVDAKTAAEHARMVSGNYISARGAFDDWFALTGLMGQIRVVTNPDGTISFPVLRKYSGEPVHYREIAPFVWRAVGGHERFTAIVKDGKVVRVSSETLAPIMVWDRAPASRDASWIMPAAQAGAVVVILTALGWPLLAIIRRRYGQSFALTGKRAQAYRIVRIGAVAAVIGMGAWMYLLQSLGAPGALEALGYNDGQLLLIYGLGFVGFVGGLVTSLYNSFVVFTEKSSWFARLWAVLLTLAFLALVWFAHVGGLLSFSTNY